MVAAFETACVLAAEREFELARVDEVAWPYYLLTDQQTGSERTFTFLTDVLTVLAAADADRDEENNTNHPNGTVCRCHGEQQPGQDHAGIWPDPTGEEEEFGDRHYR